ncbi:NADH-quinone oxidoreductase subunit L [soil metagenome]
MLETLYAVPGRIFVFAAVLPLGTAVLLFLAGTAQRLRNAETGRLSLLAGWLVTGTMMASAALSIIGLFWLQNDLTLYAEMPATIASRWSEKTDLLRVGGTLNDPRPGLALAAGYTIDRITALMMCMVTIIGSLIFLFSIGYMHGESKRDVEDHTLHLHRRGRFARFFFYLSLFAFSMLHLLIADNLLQIFVSWELVGVSSFFLIGFYYERESASNAANKAFIMNRIGDAGFLIGICVAFTQFGTLNLNELLAAFHTQDHGGMDHTLWVVMGLGLFAGCVGKSAQFPLQTWLPDAMEGPTPVSAMVHAATMVAAGVYLAARCLPLFAPEVLTVIAWTGAITLVLSALTAMVQTDIKRVLAFSTCSQLGYMMLAIGLMDATAGLFHLITHAFFKALLFLGAGSVIHAIHHEQDLLKMGGLRKKLPVTAYTMLLGVMAIVGVPFFSGWYSKDAILETVYVKAIEERQWIFFIAAFGTVILTAYYMTRLWLLAFAGSTRNQHIQDHAAESPSVMLVPLLILSVFSISVAWGDRPWYAHQSYLNEQLHLAAPELPVTMQTFPSHLLNDSHDPRTDAELLGLLCALTGVVIAVTRHRKQSLATKSQLSMLKNRFYFDELYSSLFTKPVLAFSRLTGSFDKQSPAKTTVDYSLDGLFTAAGTLVNGTGRRLAPLQSGRIRGYVLALGLTVVAALGILYARSH